MSLTRKASSAPAGTARSPRRAATTTCPLTGLPRWEGAGKLLDHAAHALGIDDDPPARLRPARILALPGADLQRVDDLGEDIAQRPGAGATLLGCLLGDQRTGVLLKHEIDPQGGEVAL